MARSCLAFRLIMAVIFLSGTWIYTDMSFIVSSNAMKVLFCLIGAFSLLSAAGMIFSDGSSLAELPFSAKLSAMLMCASVNAGAFAARILLEAGKDNYAFISAVGAISAAIICGSILAGGLLRDDPREENDLPGGDENEEESN